MAGTQTNDIELTVLEPQSQGPKRDQLAPNQLKNYNIFLRILYSFGPAEQEDPKLADSPLKRKLKGRHLQFIAIGGSIGAGLFIGCGKALAMAGPASLLLAFTLVSIMVFCTVHALGELASLNPVQGSFAVFATRFIDKSWGFAMGWNYALQWLVVLPFELTAASLTLQYWDTGVHMAIWITIFWVMITFINFAGVRGYGECEMVFAVLKVTAIVVFVITGIVVDCGGGPNGQFIGFKYFKDPGPFNHGFAGLCSAFITAGFSLAGTELVGLAAAETDNPRRNVPRAAKQVFWRIILFYFTSLIVIACTVPYTHPQLLVQAHSADVRASPFVIAIQDAGIKVLPHIINAVILISVLSVGNSSTYASTRTLNALAEMKQAPRILKYVDKVGRPLASQVLCLGCGLLAYFGCLPGGAPQLFDWLLQISALSSFFTWASICVAHIRYRAAMKFHGRSLKYVPFKAWFGIWGSWVGLILNVSCIVAQIYVASSGLYGSFNFVNWLGDVVAVPVILLFFIVWKLCRDKANGEWVNLEDMDLVTGRREITEAEYAEREERRNWTCWQRVVRFFC